MTTDNPEHPPTYTMTFEEVEGRVANNETLISSQGYIVSSRDRKLSTNECKDLWLRDVAAAKTRGDITETPKKKEVTAVADPRPLDKKGRPFSWSFSALNNFEGCPLRYAKEKFYKILPYVQSDAAIWGDRVHKAAENFVKGLPVTDPDALAVVIQYATAFKKIKDAGAVVVPELQIVLDRNMKPLTGPKAWFSKDAWFRCMIDVPVIQGVNAKIFDYKSGGSLDRSGNVKDEVEQLKLCSVALSIARPDLEIFTGKLIYTKHKQVTQGCVITKGQVPGIWQGYLGRVKRMEDAWRSENFAAKPSWLCKWRRGTAMGGGQCGYYDQCEYHG